MKTLNRIRDFASLYRMYRRHYTPLRAARYAWAIAAGG